MSKPIETRKGGVQPHDDNSDSRRKGRLTIPKDIRKTWGIDPGERFFLEAEDGALRFTRAENPFDLLAQHAIAEYRAGRTKSLQAFAAENGFSLND